MKSSVEKLQSSDNNVRADGAREIATDVHRSRPGMYETDKSIRPLLSLLQDSNNSNIRVRAYTADALAELAWRGYSYEIYAAGGVEILLAKVLSNDHENVKKHCRRALSGIMSHDQEPRNSITGRMTELVQLLESASKDYAYLLLTSIQGMHKKGVDMTAGMNNPKAAVIPGTHNQSNQNAIREAGGIPILSRLFMEKGDSLLFGAIFWWLAEQNGKNQIAIAETGVLPLLEQLTFDPLRKYEFLIDDAMMKEMVSRCRTMYEVEMHQRRQREQEVLKLKKEKEVAQQIAKVNSSFANTSLSIFSPATTNSSISDISQPTSKPSSLNIPTIAWNELELGRELGRGGFGIVSEGKWQKNTRVAIKQLMNQALPEDILQEFQQETQTHLNLRHPNIVSLYGVCLESAKYAMVLEFMTQGSLFGVLHNSKIELPWSQRITIAADAIAGLVYLHSRSIIHGDLKSLNVLLDEHGKAKLADFGLSKVKGNTATGTVSPAVGTLSWMAPELFSRGGKRTIVTDVYAMGIILWELATRQLPWNEARGNQALIMSLVKDGEREEIPTNTPAGFSALIQRCWAQRAEDRPTSQQIADTLSNLQVDSGYMHFSGK